MRRLVTCSACRTVGHKAPKCPDYARRALHYLGMIDRNLDPENMAPWIIDHAPDAWPETRRLAKVAIAIVEKGADLQHAMRVLDLVIDTWPRYTDAELEGLLVGKLFRKRAVIARRAVQLRISELRNS